MANPENLEGQGFDAHPERINRAGRPKGARSRTTIVREALEAILQGSDQMVVDAITAAQIAKAMTGDTSAFKELMDSGFGKIADKQITATTTLEDILGDIDGTSADLPQSPDQS